jgi:integrase/recombinase XerC
MRPPNVPEQPVPVLAPDDLRRLLKVCDGKGLVARRASALLLVFIDTEARLAEVAGLKGERR